MGENSGIQWTTHTFNPWVGCQRVSPGCENCYAETLDRRVGGGVDPKDGVKKLRWGPTAPRVRTTEKYWKQPAKWNAKALALGQRHRVFCASLADVFEDRAELRPWRLDLFTLIKATPGLDWLVLTKRPENICDLLPGEVEDYPNIWWGTTVEDQKRADQRWPELFHQTRYAKTVRFLSLEPLIQPAAIKCAGCNGTPGDHMAPDGGGCTGAFPDWFIIGGESGGNARRFEMGWAIDLVAGARTIGAAPFVKQMGSRPTMVGGPIKLRDSHGGDPAEWPEALRVREFPKPRGGA